MNVACICALNLVQLQIGKMLSSTNDYIIDVTGNYSFCTLDSELLPGILLESAKCWKLLLGNIGIHWILVGE